ncbi:MAG TPA: methyl-accepting chemotaxis protein [Magnetospirillum sp.]|nr:methyl-accepting chemotaxis protein [Magnetospirillum sp.]
MRMSIAMRLAVGFGAVMALSLGLSLFQLSNFRSAIDFLESVTQRDFRAYRMVVTIAHGRGQLRAMRELAVIQGGLGGETVEPVTLADYRAATDQVLAAMKELSALAHARAADADVVTERSERWNAMAINSDEMVVLERQIATKAEGLFSLLHQGRAADAARALYSVSVEHQALNVRQDAIESLIADLAEAGRANVRQTLRETTRTAFGAIVLMLLAAAGAGMLISGSIGGALRRFMGFVQMVGVGDLTHTLPEEGSGELARMGAHLNAMRNALRQVATQTRAAAENVNAATAQIRASAQQQAAASTEQLSAIEETSATLTEITQSGAQITRRAQDVERIAQAAVQLADQGQRAVVSTMQAMDSIREQAESVASTILRLSERTQAISEIILTVTTIAERSHLLALNASIEAAAAGEHGRTFSVVAGEIKRLADQAREATLRVRENLGQIQQGITDSVMLAEEAAKRVEAGRTQTQSSDRIIRDMAGAIQESVRAFQQIVAATNQHQIGLEQVMQALAAVRQAASQTSTTTRELEGAAGNLNGLSESLVDAVRNYRL